MWLERCIQGFVEIVLKDVEILKDLIGDNYQMMDWKMYSWI